MTNIILIVYYSKKCATQKMANEVARGAEAKGAKVVIKTVVDCTMVDLLSADAIAFGSPTYYCNIAWQPKKFIDETILDFYAQGHSLNGKVCGCFTSTGGYDDGRECLRMLELMFGYTLKMCMVPGVILESKAVAQGTVSECYDLGQRLVVALADIR
jgi:multimeric flavodoxin WrbA